MQSKSTEILIQYNYIKYNIFILKDHSSSLWVLSGLRLCLLQSVMFQAEALLSTSLHK